MPHPSVRSKTVFEGEVCKVRGFLVVRQPDGTLLPLYSPARKVKEGDWVRFNVVNGPVGLVAHIL